MITSDTHNGYSIIIAIHRYKWQRLCFNVTAIMHARNSDVHVRTPQTLPPSPANLKHQVEHRFCPLLLPSPRNHLHLIAYDALPYHTTCIFADVVAESTDPADCHFSVGSLMETRVWHAPPLCVCSCTMLCVCSCRNRVPDARKAGCHTFRILANDLLLDTFLCSFMAWSGFVRLHAVCHIVNLIVEALFLIGCKVMTAIRRLRCNVPCTFLACSVSQRPPYSQYKVKETTPDTSGMEKLSSTPNGITSPTAPLIPPKAEYTMTDRLEAHL